MKAIYPGQTPIPLRSGTWILDLSHDPIWAIWLAEVRKFDQHHDRMFCYTWFCIGQFYTYISRLFEWHYISHAITQVLVNQPKIMLYIYPLITDIVNTTKQSCVIIYGVYCKYPIKSICLIPLAVLSFKYPDPSMINVNSSYYIMVFI